MFGIVDRFGLLNENKRHPFNCNGYRIIGWLPMSDLASGRDPQLILDGRRGAGAFGLEAKLPNSSH